MDEAQAVRKAVAKLAETPSSMSLAEWQNVSRVFLAAADEIERLRRIETAAKSVANTLNGGFIACPCGRQESTLDVSKLTAIDANLGKVTVGKRFDEGHHMTVNLQDVGEDLRRALKDMAKGS